jgi:ATP-dependent DNA helicase RecQ
MVVHARRSRQAIIEGRHRDFRRRHRSPVQALSLLQDVFGYPAFRGDQAAIIEHVASGGDALVLMPTGGGKSLCYQIPAMMRDGVGVVVSPLIALMQDQDDALAELGVRAAFLNSTLSAADAAAIERRVRKGDLDLVYVAPERLLTDRCLGLLDESRLALFAIDEAHCVSQWGHDFRPEYIQLSVLHERYPQVPRIALTATADALTRAEIVERLELRDARMFVSSFDRPNIRYRIVEKDDPRKQLLELLRTEHPGDSGIVYCLSRKKVDETAHWLASQGIPALPYHAGMSADDRRANQARFLREDGIVMVATIAFGMGIDKPDVRFVAHLDLPKSIEGYYQETGRAGRDGLPSTAWMTYG